MTTLIAEPKPYLTRQTGLCAFAALVLVLALVA